MVDTLEVCRFTTTCLLFGLLAQLVRALALQARSRRFKPGTVHCGVEEYGCPRDSHKVEIDGSNPSPAI